MLKPKTSHSELEIQQLLVADAPLVLDVWQQAKGKEYGITFLENELAQQTNCHHYGAFTKGGQDHSKALRKVQGLITLGWIGRYGKTVGLYVAPDCRRQGIASLLLQHLLDAGRTLNLVQINLDVLDNNIAAIKLYRRFGFRPTESETLPTQNTYHQRSFFISLI
tara:strand:+ start:11244 stop:11738 length:495 start_codon:yes stop_codon:yes gene_type:complete